MKRRLAFFLIAVLTALAGCNNRSWSSGDRVLVAKFPYDSGISKPERFNVVVFKYPKEPLKNNVPTNYIKRLLGLPGEIMAIFFGRLYRTAPAEGQPPFFDEKNKKDVNPLDLWKSTFTHQDDPKSQEMFDAGHFEIIRKPPHVMMALRRIVYDNDFPAADLKGPAWQRWRPADGSGWAADQANGFTHGGAKKNGVDVGQVGKPAGPDWLRYRHLLRPITEPPVPGRPELITDFMSYNTFQAQDENLDLENNYHQPNWVGDLMLECKLDVVKAEGEFWMELSKGIHRFQVRWDLATGACTLFKVDMDHKKTELDTKPTRVKAPGSYQLRFANFDARLTVWVDRDLPFEDGHNYPPPENRDKNTDKGLDDAELQKRLQDRLGPTKNDLEPASIGANPAAVHIHGLRLWRDTYYTQNGQNSDLSIQDWADETKWGDFKKLKPRTIYVQPGHYLCLGDNSPKSSDGREWGLVPERLLLGRALLVYFPIPRAGPIR